MSETQDAAPGKADHAEAAEQAQAAQTIQRHYRGYRERRQLAGIGLDASARWTEVRVFTVLDQSTRVLTFLQAIRDG